MQLLMSVITLLLLPVLRFNGPTGCAAVLSSDSTAW
jgi:hypothetical protein